MTKCKDALTNEQRELAAKNHNLIYKFAHKMNISIDEYYDILAIALCNAAKIFNRNKGSFSTLAYKCMNNELNTYWSKTKKESSIPSTMIFSYDAPVEKNDCYGNSFKDIVEDDYQYKEMISGIISKEFIYGLTDQEKQIVHFLLLGLKRQEIADKMGWKRQNVNYHLNKIREKAKYLL